VWTAGICVGLIHDIPTCDDLLKRIESEAGEIVKQQASLFQEDSKARL
jgi:NAD(P)H-dependent flavin oxidoreductase YrpB (nitropropane dioxygenase family)